MYRRRLVDTIVQRLEESRHFIQVVLGARQTGKSTAVNQALEELPLVSIPISFDYGITASQSALHEVWQQARSLYEREQQGVVLSLDEIQNVVDWSGIVKHYWDEDTLAKRDIRVVISGSSSLLLQRDLQESLTGRYEVIPFSHWSFGECKEAFDYSLDDYLYFGGYPGPAVLRNDRSRWLSYMNNSIIEPTLARDVLYLEEVRKPALMRALFSLGCAYSGQELSFRKIVGQLDESGSVATAAYYLELLEHADILAGLKKYANKELKKRSSSPRFMVFDPSLLTVSQGDSSEEMLQSQEQRGHVIESAVGSYLLARSKQDGFTLHWWREGNKEVDFVLQKGQKRTAIEVKSGRIKRLNGIARFLEEFPGTYSMIIGSKQASIEDFLLGRIPLFQ